MKLSVRGRQMAPRLAFTSRVPQLMRERYSDNPESMPTLELPSVQSLLIEMAYNDQPLSTGTGFAVQSARGPLLLTNWHNVAGRRPDNGQPLSPTGALPNRIHIWHNRKGTLGEWVARTEDLYSGDSPRWIEHPQFRNRVDAVALPLSSLDDVALYPHALDAGSDIFVGPADSVSVVGFPFGLQAGGSLAVWATGFIASEPDIDFSELPVLLVDCRTRPGQSGSAVIAHRPSGMVRLTNGNSAIKAGPVTKFIGIYSGRINEQSDLGIVWKASALGEIVAAV